MRKSGNKLERLAGATGGLVARHPGKIVIAFAIVTAMMFVPMTDIESETRMSDFIPDNEFTDANEWVREQFAGTRTITNIVEAEDGNVMDREGLLALMAMEDALVASPEVSSYLIGHRDPVLSVADAVEGALRGSSNGTVGIADAPEPLLQEVVSATLEDPEASVLVSEGEGRERAMCVLLVIFDYGEYYPLVEAADMSVELAIEEEIEMAAGEGYLVYSMGAWDADLQKSTEEDLGLLLPITIVMLSAILLVALRSLRDWALAFAGLGVIMVLSFGMFGLLGLQFTQMTFFVPIMMMILSIDFIVHVLIRYNEERRREDHVPVAMSRAIRFIGVSILLSALTTIVAFASNGLSDIPAVAGFGVFLAIGIGISFLVMVLFVPASKVLADRVLPEKAPRARRAGTRRWRPSPGRGLAALGRRTESAPLAILVGSLLLTGGAFYGASLLEKDMSPHDLMAEDSEKLIAIDALDERFPGIGTERVSVVVVGDIGDPATLEAMDTTVANMGDDAHVAQVDGRPNTVSVLDYVRAVTNSGMVTVEDKDGNGLPDTREDAREVLDHLYANGIPGVVPARDVQGVLSSGTSTGSYDSALILIESRDVAGSKCSEALEEIKEDTDPLEELAGTEVMYAGYVFERHVLLDSMTDGMTLSTMVTIVICTVMVSVLFWSIRFGLVAALPMVMVTVWVLGTSYLLGFDLNPVTATTTALTVGIGIDYSIHLTERYRQERSEGRTVREALDVTMERTGPALVIAGATTASGFGIIAFSNIGMFNAFGVLAFLIITFVMVASLVVLPAFIVTGEQLSELASGIQSKATVPIRNGR